MQVVHIDLGIAFEQGRFLNTPELVPFRLTRDIVDGMGAAGKACLAWILIVAYGKFVDKSTRGQCLKEAARMSQY